MRTVADIDREIHELEEKLERIEGQPTEVYSRIVGYYRSLKNWNRGKREEYSKRVVFVPGLEGRAEAADSAGAAAAAAPASAARASATPAVAVTGAGQEDSQPASYLYFFRETCPNCPPVRSILAQIGLPGTEMDVDTNEGTRAALENGIYATPTVVFLNSAGAEVYRASTAAELRELEILQLA